jgi:hypothetical protein
MERLTIPARTVDGRVLVYASTVALSAFLLFVVQPLFTRMVLPHLGGTAAVWNVCVMWFQGALLGGYFYAHILSAIPRVRTQVLIHLAVLTVSSLALPIGMAERWTAPDEGTPIPWLVALLTISIGAPFFAVSATAPLLQRWFSLTDHPNAIDPYPLYSASNIGGLLALFSYPLLIEPFLGLQGQAWAWSGAYALLIAFVGLAGLAVHRSQGLDRSEPEQARPNPPGWTIRLRWMALAFVPSSLLLAVTLFLTTDVAAVAFLWVAPLGLYLLSFVLVFARRPLLRHDWMVTSQACLLVVLALAWHTAPDFILQLGLHLAVLFVTAMVCHGELAKRRPAPRQLTEFYLWISIGGLLGSVFTVLVAPVLFRSVMEYPLILVVACLLREARAGAFGRSRWMDIALPAGFALVYIAARTFLLPLKSVGLLVLYAVFGVVLFSFAGRPLRFALGLAVLLFAPRSDAQPASVLLRERSFFGVYRVEALDDGVTNYLYHGTTIHGLQPRYRPGRLDPFSYYHRAGPLGQLFRALGDAGMPVRQIGVAGLGIGTIASYKKDDQAVTFFEIDPKVVEIASNPDFFNYLNDFGKVDVVLGDARLSLTKQPDARFDLLVLDAFSADAVPVHLLTREALALYSRKLSDHGLIAFHITNRYVQFAPVLGALAADAGLSGRIQYFRPSVEEAANGAYVSTWAVLGRYPEELMSLTADDRWQALPPGNPDMLWTDDYTNLLRILQRPAWLRRIDSAGAR